MPDGPVVAGAASPGGWRQWRATPLAAQVYVAAATVIAVVFTAGSVPGMVTSPATGITLVLLAAGSVLNIELGRWLEGRRLERDRTHKGMSAWPFTAALLLPAGVAGWIAVLGYAHMRARGIRIPLWKWVVSWTAVTLGSVAAAHTVQHAGGLLPGLGSGRVMLAVLLAGTAFLLTEALVLFIVSRLNDDHDEVHLRRALAHPDFYVTELVVLASAATVAILMRYSPWAILLTVPGYVQLQRAVIYRALREESRVDGKTGLLNSETWRTEAVAALDRAQRRGQGLAVLIADLDHFKSVNDTHGHLFGDEVLAATATALAQQVRQGDLVGRFGGEEFCLLLPDVDRSTALAVAERIRAQVERLTRGDLNVRVTVSIGLAVADPAGPHRTLPELIELADRKLYEAKHHGRNRVRS